MGVIKKNDGGILILLVYVIAIVLLLSVTVMANTVMSYKMRVSNITYVSNAYMSDGGLDEANALAILSYEETSSDTLDYITEIVEGSIQSIERIKTGEQSYILSPYRKYIHPLNLTLKKNEIRNEFERYFIQLFRDGFTGRINNFESQIDERIDVTITGSSSASGKCIYHIESTYSEKGITRKNGVNLIITYPHISFHEDNNFEIVHQNDSVSRNNWRVIYAQ